VARKARWRDFQVRNKAAKMIQKNWKNTRWVRIMNMLVSQRRHSAAELAQSIMRGYVSRQKTLEEMKRTHLGEHMVYFEELKEKLRGDA